MNWLSTPFRLPDNIMHPEPDYFTAPFNKSKSDFFLIDDKDTFFPPSTRNRIVRMICHLILVVENLMLLILKQKCNCIVLFFIHIICKLLNKISLCSSVSLFVKVYYILSRCSYVRDECGDRDKKGIKRLLSNGTYAAAFPLHDVSLFKCVLVAFQQFLLKALLDVALYTIYNRVLNEICVVMCPLSACSVDTGKDQRILTAKVRDTISTSTGPDSSASSKSSPSTL